MTSIRVDYEYNTTALRLAAVFTANDIGSIVRDHENGGTYMVIGTGSGVTSMAALPGTYGYVSVPLNTFRECDANGDVGDGTANGGVLASNTTPILLGIATTEQLAINWATSGVDPIITEVALPEDFDGTQDVVIQAQVTSGSTDAFSATIDTTWQGGTLVADTLAGSASATLHTATATVAAADVADSPETVTIKITPAAHSNDAFQLESLRIRYVRK